MQNACKNGKKIKEMPKKPKIFWKFSENFFSSILSIFRLHGVIFDVFLDCTPCYYTFVTFLPTLNTHWEKTEKINFWIFQKFSWLSVNIFLFMHLVDANSQRKCRAHASEHFGLKKMRYDNIRTSYGSLKKNYVVKT